jgi:hypothetical protein
MHIKAGYVNENKAALLLPGLLSPFFQKSGDAFFGRVGKSDFHVPWLTYYKLPEPKLTV